MPRPVKLLALLGASAVSAVPAAEASFVAPDGFGWSRGDANTTYVEWETFTDPTGGNAPDVGLLPDPLPDGSTTPDDADASGVSFITSSGNIYAFEGVLDITANFPSFGLGPDTTTTVLVQVRTQGFEIDPQTVLIDGTAPVETIELERIFIGEGQFGGFLVDTLYRFEITGNADDYQLTFMAAEASMALDRLSIDVLAQESSPCPGDVTADQAVDLADLNLVLANFGTATTSGDATDDGFVDLADLNLVLANFGELCG